MGEIRVIAARDRKRASPRPKRTLPTAWATVVRSRALNVDNLGVTSLGDTFAWYNHAHRVLESEILIVRRNN
jgi:hypothetical protein